MFNLLFSDISAFFLHPQSQTTQEGAQLTLTCVTGKSAPPPQIYWIKDGSLFEQGNQSKVTYGSIGDGGALQQTMQLKLTAKPEYSGMYHCVAKNPLTMKVERSNGANISVSCELLLMGTVWFDI